MKPYSYKFFAAIALTALGLTLTGCAQPQAAEAPAATPAPATTVIEDVHRGHDDDRDAQKVQQDRDRRRPDDPERRDRP
jgi:hypothetical protein